MNLSAPIEEISRVGLQYQKRLKRLGIKTVEDFLFHFPHRYEDFSNLTPIANVKLGETVCVQGEIIEIENTRTWKKRMFLTQAILKDESGIIRVVWFNQPYIINTLKKGDKVCLAGRTAKENGIYLSSPAYEKIYSTKEPIHTGRIIPVYPETEGLSSRWLRYILKPLLGQFKNKIVDPLPSEIIKKNHLLSRSEALYQIHFPCSMKMAEKAKERFSFEEVFLIELRVLKERLALKRERAISIPLNLKLIKEFVKSLPFQLTPAQKKSGWQILKDMEKSRPMNRLLEGDVGSGKTIVAAMAILNVVNSGYQTAFMAPTEILAKQHFKTLNELFNKKFLNKEIKIGILTSQDFKISEKKVSKKKLLESLKTGEIDVLLGTHALIQENVKFGKLALVILDEQHRFGIEQRAKLCQQKKFIPHLLSMTATPIPRTLALTLYGDLDLSLIDELPKGRKKIITRVIPPDKRNEVYDFIRKEVKKGRQVFVICPRIETSTQNNNKNISWAEAKAVKQEYEKLSKEIFPHLKIAQLHGKMKSREKEDIMRNFQKGGIDILVSTSVIEVGIDVPNATLMIIEGAERFGLAQLHQFRGRVGRGKDQSFCFLFTDSPAKKTGQRLRAILTSENGFELAEKDLKIRGPGEISGMRQWGIPDLAMSSLKDIFLVEKIRQEAKNLLEKDPELKQYPLLKEKIKKFGEKIHLE